ncbi:MAG: hypothetical protein A3B99_00135 [Candidatus Yanofskybacteria bacterium RIFCSPHIGHO2_02_FULL_44_12b]|uniref:DUF5671 domain-containing protein n=2 Tax=Candidatus Yanofskyibacteriota TaxID=1752733 RepID=A0A1F8GMK2_9BACT|nr:MAG: hypothetical protein UW79_C0013G0010 [Candidatus Yanofskybacteria bacterium GW2011_GWA2_44_9]OGN04160.1 MAG: hypothetical protein A2659_01580 [Candidatus Yanofskybacteria bacterium RIFCSPHIGHO2_01_FULL_44_24]OGN14754.1 MAG: hypothetical protein A3B99_00135 [Candidatus Yanofskybacteria bacterium RIFCSPHIGHO2_02_FULL_44_12b]OGN25886.1 MAG: hypothetical protein A2925_02500 [Candidatus Yanofskybacteria bacterium RIFCSPLOWO2_01_FULL_44_22]
MAKSIGLLAIFGYILFLAGWVLGGINYFDGMTPLVPKDSIEAKMMMFGMCMLVISVTSLSYSVFFKKNRKDLAA